jgi:hypothetical protein
MRVKEFAAFIRERFTIWERRQDRKPVALGPFADCKCKLHWTHDPILQHYRFCNVYRELDTVTQWIANNWREPHKCDIDLWFAMVVARKVNYPEALAEIGYPVPWKPENFKKAIGNRIAKGLQVESGAYMITAGTGKKWIGQPKYIFLSDAVFGPLWEQRAAIRPTGTDTLASFHARLQKAGMTVGSFIAGQVVADLKYARPLSRAKDWSTWAAMGPGSARGLNRVLGFPVTDSWREDEWYQRLLELAAAIRPVIKRFDMEPFHNQDVQNCLCEFDKYERVRLGEGRPRSLYVALR